MTPAKHSTPGQVSRERVRYLKTRDGVQLAWAAAGSGPVIVKAAHWMTHLEYDWESPVWKHWTEFLTANFHTVRYDERGCGLSDWTTANFSPAQWVSDLEAVIEAAGVTAPLTLLGMSQGGATCLAYTRKHPERVSRLILYGAYARGGTQRGNPDHAREHLAMLDLIRAGWNRENPVFRQLFTSRFIPQGTDEQMRWFNDLCLKTTSPQAGADMLAVRARIDMTDDLGDIRVPTLVLHARKDAAVPFEEGRILASGIPGAEFVELDSCNHILLEHEPAWARFRGEVLDFMGVTRRGAEGEQDPAFAALSPREREILSGICEGLGNAEIGERLSISEKTVRNHVSNVFDKLGVWTRAQAIVFARDRGFR
jgi:pimeloyl-ACP methyl ester carboxylesterase/DNA-binding CsgD family transcriptional regulator